MNSEKKEKYKALSARAGLTCSCFLIVAVIMTSASETFEHHSMWIVMVSGLIGVVAFIAAIVCVTTAVIGRVNPD
jgi:membrane protein YdbS with pleckstrin-like domain